MGHEFGHKVHDHGGSHEHQATFPSRDLLLTGQGKNCRKSQSCGIENKSVLHGHGLRAVSAKKDATQWL